MVGYGKNGAVAITVYDDSQDPKNRYLKVNCRTESCVVELEGLPCEVVEQLLQKLESVRIKAVLQTFADDVLAVHDQEKKIRKLIVRLVSEYETYLAIAEMFKGE